MFDPLTPESLITPANVGALLASTCIGGLVGLVRQWNEGDRAVAGVRTFALWSTFGFVMAQMERAGVPWMTLAGLAVTTALIAAFSFRKEAASIIGLTTMTAAVMTYAAGTLLGYGLARYAIGLAIIIAGLIGVRRITATWSGRLTETDVRAGLQFAFLTGVILPLVPDEKLWGVFNPYDTWRMVMLVAGVNLTGYAAMRFLGERAGAALTGLVGGLASSTAVTLAFSRRSREQPEHGAAYAQAVLLACSVMVPRVLVVLFALRPELGAALLFPAGVVFIATAATPAWLRFRDLDRAEGAVPPVENPLRLAQSVKFALLYSLIVFLLDASRDFAGAAGLHAVSFVAGLTDMDAITLSLANRTGAGEITVASAALAILIALGANTLLKLGLALAMGTGRFRRLVAIGLGAPLVAAIVVTLTRLL
jgi:uncharacterized membrane protein (DUF4010 family)